jgi:predicted CoA-binding protein
MNHDTYTDDYLAGILHSVKTIALTGASPNPARPSNGVMGYLLSRGYEVIPVNPGQVGKQIQGRTVYARLADIPVPIDMVEVFRASEYLDGVVEEALALKPLPKIIMPARSPIPPPARGRRRSIRPRPSCSTMPTMPPRCSACRRSATSIPASATRPTRCWKSASPRSKAAPRRLRSPPATPRRSWCCSN